MDTSEMAQNGDVEAALHLNFSYRLVTETAKSALTFWIMEVTVEVVRESTLMKEVLVPVVD